MPRRSNSNSHPGKFERVSERELDRTPVIIEFVKRISATRFPGWVCCAGRANKERFVSEFARILKAARHGDLFAARSRAVVSWLPIVVFFALSLPAFAQTKLKLSTIKPGT